MIERPTIASAIVQLREQLIEAMKEGEGKSLRFLPKLVEIDLSLVFKASASAEMKAGGFWSILELSGSGQASKENTHKVKLTLEPVELVEEYPYSEVDGHRTYFRRPVISPAVKPPIIEPASDARTEVIAGLKASDRFGMR